MFNTLNINEQKMYIQDLDSHFGTYYRINNKN